MVTDFIFDGQALSDYGYMLLLEGEEEIVVSNMTFETIKGARSDASQNVGYTYGEPYSTTFTIMKNMCVYDEDEQFLTRDDISEMVRWLSQKQFKWFRFIDNDDNDEIWYKVQVQINKAMVGDRCYGLQLVVTANAPYGYTREITKTLVGVRGNDTFEMPVVGDEYGYYYPDVEVEMYTNGVFNLTNLTAQSMRLQGANTGLANCKSGEIINFYGDNVIQIVSTNDDHEMGTDFTYKFPMLVASPGISSNTFRVNDDIDDINCNITMKYRGIRKVGFE